MAAPSGPLQLDSVFTTPLTTLDNKVVIIPNAKIMGDSIIHYSPKETRRVDLNFGVSYSDDIDKGRKCIRDVIHNEARILKEPETAILVQELAESKLVFQVRPWVKGTDYRGVYFDVIEAVRKGVDSPGISIPVPQRNVHVYEHRKG